MVRILLAAVDVASSVNVMAKAVGLYKMTSLAGSTGVDTAKPEMEKAPVGPVMVMNLALGSMTFELTPLASVKDPF